MVTGQEDCSWRAKDQQVPAERAMSTCFPGAGILGTGKTFAGIVGETDGC